MKNALCIIGLAALLALGCWLSYELGRKRAKSGQEGAVTVRVDTLVVRDTLTLTEVKETTRYRDREVYVPVTDTLRLHDTLYVALDREVAVYQGDDYRAVVSGVRPALDTISVYPRTVYITTTQTMTERRRWSFGVTAGPGLLYDGKLHGGMGIVAGLQYSF